MNYDNADLCACLQDLLCRYPASVTKGIGASAFESCTALDSVTCLIEEPYAFDKKVLKK